MLVGIVADVHSNEVALKAVLSGLHKLGVEKILHAGDVIGYNPYPNETIGLFKKHKIISILGNHDRALLTQDTSGFNPYAAFALWWTEKTISSDSKNYILGLKDVVAITAGGKRIVMVHGSPYDFDEYIYPSDVMPEFLSIVDADILVLGHTHIPFIKEYTEGIIVNPGSVGQPRDGNPKAAFAVLDTDAGSIRLHRTDYDVEKVIEDMLSTRLPEKLAFRLRAGI